MFGSLLASRACLSIAGGVDEEGGVLRSSLFEFGRADEAAGS